MLAHAQPHKGPLSCISSAHSHHLLAAAAVVRAEGGNGSSEYDYDIITIGAGSGGVRASRFATSYGERAAHAAADQHQQCCVWHQHHVSAAPRRMCSSDAMPKQAQEHNRV